MSNQSGDKVGSGNCKQTQNRGCSSITVSPPRIVELAHEEFGTLMGTDLLDSDFCRIPLISDPASEILINKENKIDPVWITRTIAVFTNLLERPSVSRAI